MQSTKLWILIASILMIILGIIGIVYVFTELKALLYVMASLVIVVGILILVSVLRARKQ